MATTTSGADKASDPKTARDEAAEAMNPYSGKDIPAGASKPEGELVSQVSGGGEPATEPSLADHHDIAYRDRDPGVVNDGLGSVGAQRPGERIVKSKDDAAGTLVENFPDMRDENPATSEAVNRANPAPQSPVARQPSESDEAYAERTKSSRSTARSTTTKRNSTKASAKDSKQVEGKTPISEDGRRLLREAAAHFGLDSAMGNRLADWLDAHPTAQVYIAGKTPEPPLRVFGTPDVDPVIEEPAPFTR